MAYIKYINYDDGSPVLQRAYQRYGGADKSPADIVRISGVSPKTMDGHIDLYRGIQGTDSALKPSLREMIAVVVSGINQCHY